MSTIYVWALVFYMMGYQTSSQSGGPAVIDNIASQQECERIAKVLAERERVGIRYLRCIQIQKVKP